MLPADISDAMFEGLKLNPALSLALNQGRVEKPIINLQKSTQFTLKLIE